MKYTPYLSIPFGIFTREISRAEAAEILRRARKAGSQCWKLRTSGMICLGGLWLTTKPLSPSHA